MPVVPRIDRPPTMPRRPLAVRSAIFSPPGTEISTTASAPAPSRAATSSRLARIIARGAGLIAGSPTGSGRPGRVTVPTPSPALKLTPAPGGARRTVATISAPWVTSGSSPASLTMPARAKSAPSSWVARANSGLRPFGSATGTGSGNRPVRSASKAARAAPLAQAPVVQPRLSGVVAFRLGHARWRSASDRLVPSERAYDAEADVRERWQMSRTTFVSAADCGACRCRLFVGQLQSAPAWRSASRRSLLR